MQKINNKMLSRSLLSVVRYFSSQAAGKGLKKNPVGGSVSSASSGQTAKGIDEDVPGLSSKCIKAATSPVGPGAATSAAYKVPEYFCYDRFSFAEAEVEMSKYRCPQPSALKK